MNESMQRLVNENTKKVHKAVESEDSLRSVCGAVEHVPSGNLRRIPVEDGGNADTVDKCGRCFEDGGGY